MKQLKKVQTFRILIQILMLFILPGLFIMAFSELKEILKMLLSGNMHFLQALPSLLEFTTATVLTILLGRIFCGWLCAFGAYNDLIYLASKKVFKTRFKMNEKLDSYLKYVKYLILYAIFIISCILGSTLFSNASPWDVFAQITDFPNILVSMPIGALLLLAITIGAFFIERFFCRYLCPLGAFFNLVSRISFFKIRKPSDQCGKCRVCTSSCSMGLKLYKAEAVRGGDCINCLKCIDVCPRKNTCVNAFGQDVNPALASSVAIAAVVGVYGISSLGGYMTSQSNPVSSDSIVLSSGSAGATANTQTSGSVGNAGNASTTANAQTSGNTSSANTTANAQASGNTGTAGTASNPAENNSSTGSTSSTKTGSNSSSNTKTSSNNSNSTNAQSSASGTASAQQGKYKDGTYTGTGTGFRGGTTQISVTISGGKITNIETLSTRDTPRFYNYCEGTVTSKIISSQSTSVDTVSGATYSSRGIISAVKAALSKAV